MPSSDPHNEQEYFEAVGNRIRQARLARNWRQKDLALRAGVAPDSIQAIERGQRNPRFSTLCQLAKALDCDLATLL
jgi:transcriptional regulator with XRE-family HTH domain